MVGLVNADDLYIHLTEFLPYPLREVLHICAYPSSAFPTKSSVDKLSTGISYR